jgi:DNA-binding transcriptional regulator YiaG
MQPNELIELRRQLALQQYELAEMLGVNKSTVCRWESGYCPIPRIAEILLEYILYDEAA